MTSTRKHPIFDGLMPQFRKFSKKYQLPIFFLLSYLLSWWSLPIAKGLLPHGVAFAGIIVILLTQGRPGLRTLWKRLIDFRAGRLFFAAVAIIIGFKLIDIASSLIAGGELVGFPRVSVWIIAVELLLLGGLWEEPGWSGYALSALQNRFAKFKYGILMATFLAGIFRGIWHLPLVMVGAIPWYDAVWFTPFVYQPFISWLYNKSKGGLPAVIFFHYMSNLLFSLSPTFSEVNRTFYVFVYMAGGGIATLALIWATGFKLGWHREYTLNKKAGNK